jgi:glycosyl transferase family 87
MFGTYLYSPAIAQLIAPLTALPWLVFLAILTTANLAALWYLLGPWAFPALLVPVVSIELLMANINLIIAAAIVAGFRRPWTWSLVLLTKVTPGIGLLWFAVRREWRSLAIALAATGCVVAISAVIAPHLWAEWFGWLFKYAGRPPLTEAEGGWYTQPFAVPRAVRFAIAAAIVVFGALTNRPQNVPIAAVIGQPDVWGFTIALGAVPLIDWSGWRARLARRA